MTPRELHPIASKRVNYSIRSNGSNSVAFGDIESAIASDFYGRRVTEIRVGSLPAISMRWAIIRSSVSTPCNRRYGPVWGDSSHDVVDPLRDVEVPCLIQRQVGRRTHLGLGRGSAISSVITRPVTRDSRNDSIGSHGADAVVVFVREIQGAIRSDY